MHQKDLLKAFFLRLFVLHFPRPWVEKTDYRCPDRSEQVVDITKEEKTLFAQLLKDSHLVAVQI